MGREAIVYGRIIGANWRVGERFRWPHDLNRDALATVPQDDFEPPRVFEWTPTEAAMGRLFDDPPQPVTE